MTKPVAVDKDSTLHVLRAHIGDSLRRRFGGGRVHRVAVDATTVAEIAHDVAVAEIAEDIQERLDPAVAETVAEYRVLFGDYHVYLTGLIRQTMDIAKCCDELREYEFIRVTVHGSAAGSAASRLTRLLEKATGTLTELHGLRTRLPLTTDAQGLEPYTAFVARMRTLIEDTKRQAAEVGDQFEDAVDFEVVKAIVRKEPHRKLGPAFYAVRTVISGVSLAGDICGYFPNPYTTPVSIALRNLARGLAVAEAIAHRQAVALSNEKRVEEYLKTHAEGDKWEEHAKDPSTMAEMLADKRKAQLDLALVCADAAIGPVLDLFEYSDFAWEAVRQVIESTFVGYLDARLELLRKELGQVPEGSRARRAAETFGQALLDEWKDDLFKVLNPLNAVKGAVLSSVGDSIATLIWSHLPIEPGQAVDGATLKNEMDELAEKIIAGAPKRDEAFAARMAAQEQANARPTEDSGGRPVDTVLSGVLVDDANKAYRLVRIGAETGALYLDDLDFRPIQETDKVLEPLAVLPSADSKGRAIDEVDLAVGFGVHVKHPPPQGMTATQHLWVRIGTVWGYLDTATEKFWPTTVDPAAFRDWRTCVVERDGYWENGDHVKGKWYRPFPDQPGYYLFVHGDGVTHEWARSQDNTGSGRGAKNTVANLTKPSDGFDLARL